MSTETKTESNPALVRKGNATTEVIIGKSAHKLETAHKALTEAIATAASLKTLVEEATIAVTHKENQLAEIEQSLKNAKAQSDIELDLYAKSAMKAMVVDYLQKNGQVSVDIDAYNRLMAERDALRAGMEAEIKAQVGREKGILTNQFSNDVKIKEAEFNAKEAQNKATIESLTNQLNAAKQDVANWQKQLSDERAANTERSKHNAIGSVNVGSPNGR